MVNLTVAWVSCKTSFTVFATFRYCQTLTQTLTKQAWTSWHVSLCTHPLPCMLYHPCRPEACPAAQRWLPPQVWHLRNQPPELGRCEVACRLLTQFRIPSIGPCRTGAAQPYHGHWRTSRCLFCLACPGQMYPTCGCVWASKGYKLVMGTCDG